MAGGRPTKYREEFCNLYEEYKAQEISVPTREGFARYLDVSMESLRRFEKEYPKFCGTLEKLDADQKHITIQYALNGTFNAGFSKFLLSANHGMKETTGLDHSGDMNFNLTYEEVPDRKLNE